MAHRTIRPATIAGTTALLIATAGLTACGGSSTSGSSSASTPATATTTTTAAAAATTAHKSAGIPVKLSEYKIKAAVASAPAGRVVFDVSNVGKLKHQFTVIRTNKSAATVLSKVNPNDDIPGARGEIASIAPGASKKLVIKKLKAGHYAFVCALPGHYPAGMYADFTVT